MRAFVVACGLALALAGTAEARNPNCAGGIQYLTQALSDKEKGNSDDYQREITKAVQRLEMCANEDSTDLEALGYLGWAYAEAESSCAAGRAFSTAIAKMTARGDRKIDAVKNNREHYWSIAFNDGIANINSAQTLYPEIQKEPASDAEKTQKADAETKYRKAITRLTQAACLKPGDPRTLRNLGATYASMGDFESATKWFQEGLRYSPKDSDLVISMRAVGVNRANDLLKAKKWDEAIAAFAELAKTSPQDAPIHAGLADSHFGKAQVLQGDARKPEFKAAGDEYAKAAQIRPDATDYPFNSALAYQNAGEYAMAEPEWRAAVKANPKDVDALASLASTLAELKKFEEAIKTLHQALLEDSKNQNLHRQLGAVYTKAGNNAKGTEELMVYLALSKGQQVPDVAAQAKQAPAGSNAAKTLASMGNPEQINLWQAEQDKFESWFYWSKRSAYHFKSGVLVQKSDWSAPDLKMGTNTGK
jgi:tetratricopeptide (TPR) repeat protein